MGFPDFLYPQSGVSYIPSKEVLNFIETYARHYNLAAFIKFRHQVIRVRPVEESRWEVMLITAGLSYKRIIGPS